ncbi:MAG TPA: DNA polymerase III subunit delta [Caulobacteraceae bacterium]
MILSRRPEIERFLAAPGPDVRAALIYGRDPAIARERADALAKRVTARPDDPFDVALVAEDDIDDGRLEDELAAISLMGGRRLVRVSLSGDRGPVDRRTAQALDGHLAGRFNPDAFLLIQAAGLSKDSAVRKLAEKAPACTVIPCYEDEPGDLARLTRDSLAAEKVGLSSDALELFVSRLPRERGVARREIERLVLFLNPGSGLSAGAKELEQFLGVEPQTSLAEAAADAFGARLRRAYEGLRRAAQEGEGGPAAVRALGAHLLRLRRLLTYQQGGMALAAAIKAAGVFWKDEKEVLRQARVWTLLELDRLQPQLLGADRACKQTGSPSRLIAEHLALSVAGWARRLGL